MLVFARVPRVVNVLLLGVTVLKDLSTDTLVTLIVRAALDFDLDSLRMQVSHILGMIHLKHISSHFDLKAGPLQASRVSEHGEQMREPCLYSVLAGLYCGSTLLII